MCLMSISAVLGNIMNFVACTQWKVSGMCLIGASCTGIGQPAKLDWPANLETLNTK